MMMTMRMILVTGLIALCAAVPQRSSGQTNERPEVLILGTYHMGNPGRDIHNLEADDVLSATRQRELAELADILRRFRPTKIAVEAQVGSRSTVARYKTYLAGEYTLTRNEIDQIGFRLAKELGHESVYAVDEGGEFPYYRVMNYGKRTGCRCGAIQSVPLLVPGCGNSPTTCAPIRCLRH